MKSVTTTLARWLMCECRRVPPGRERRQGKSARDGRPRVFCFETADSWSAGFSLSDAPISLKAGLQRLRRAKEKTLRRGLECPELSSSLVVPGISQPVQSLRFHLSLLERGKFPGVPLVGSHFGKKEQLDPVPSPCEGRQGIDDRADKSMKHRVIFLRCRDYGRPPGFRTANPSPAG